MTALASQSSGIQTHFINCMIHFNFTKCCKVGLAKIEHVNEKVEVLVKIT